MELFPIRKLFTFTQEISAENFPVISVTSKFNEQSFPTQNLVDGFGKKLTIARTPFTMVLHRAFNCFIRVLPMIKDFFKGINNLFYEQFMNFQNVNTNPPAKKVPFNCPDDRISRWFFSPASIKNPVFSKTSKNLAPATNW
ncbi:hypothetical protein D3C87_1193050 [compost metagenome]